MNKGLLLIIDDNEDDYIIISRTIGARYQTKYCDGTGDIISMIGQLKPACLLLDYHLGCLDGCDILRQIKSHDNIATTPVMVLTNEKNPEIIVDCMKNGADDYIIKDNIQKERLLTSIGILIDKSVLQQRVHTLESILPICSYCKKIRLPEADAKQQDSWEEVDEYISKHTTSVFSHGLCPCCAQKLKEEFYEDHPHLRRK